MAMRRHSSRFLALVLISSLVTIWSAVELAPVTSVHAACYPSCRAYSYARLTNTNYTAVHAYISNAVPSIRDGGFSSEVLWIGSYTDYVEIGWRKDNSGNNKQYWEVTNGGVGGPINWLSDNTSGHDYQIEHKTSDNKWHISIDGSEKTAVSMSVSAGLITAGGEVTDWSSSNHNAMGVSGFTNLSYMVNHTGYYSWNGWNYSHIDYSYVFSSLGTNAFQDSGYNP